MSIEIPSRIMPRTTLNLDAPILRDLKRLQRRERKPLGRLVSDLLAQVLRQAGGEPAHDPAFDWHSQPLEARVDLGDKEAIRAILDREKDLNRRDSDFRKFGFLDARNPFTVSG
jgi:hypothetical protein